MNYLVYIVFLNLLSIFYCSVLNYRNSDEIPKGALTWSDEFDYTGGPNANNWIQEIGGSGWGNNELQYYTNINAFAGSGNLVIVTKKERKEQSEYTSSRLISKKGFTYGIFEVRAKLPKGIGTWPAFWLLSARRPLNWPLDGEIDILEHVGYDPGNIHANIHCSKYNHILGTNKGNNIFITSPYDQFNTYTLDWNSQRMLFYVDGKNYFSYYKEDNSYQTWPFDQDFNIILNTAVGGSWGGANGVDNNAFPASFTIDYVRHYASTDTPQVTKVFQMKSKLNNKYVSADDYGYAPLIANRDAPDGWETFRLIQNDDGSININIVVNGLFLSTEDPNWVQGKQGGIQGDFGKFLLNQNSDGSYSIKSKANNKYIRTKTGAAPQLIADSNAVGDAESYFIYYL